MSLVYLDQFISKEDFADAHEPVNDGVKEVPNAQTVAASVKTADVGTDTNSAGTPKIIPEKEDTDDATEKQHDTVSESAEKAPGSKPGGDTETPEKDSAAGATKAPPFVKKDDAETSESSTEIEEPLEHDTAEATEDEVKKTTKVTESLEGFLEHAKRFDVVGYPRAQRDNIVKQVNWLARRSGAAIPTTLSFESIDAAVGMGKARVAKLEREVTVHQARKASVENYEAVTNMPTAHGNEPMPAEAAAELTAIELDPLDVGGIIQIEEAVQTLQGAQVAIERHLEILRSNKRISKQAAAVLQAGLEHIDQVCGLKVRATGLEGYVTTPKAAMEDAEVNEKSLLDRAGEIGAKIMKWLAAALEKAGHMWDRFSNGISTLALNAETNVVNMSKLKGEPANGGELVLRPPSPEWFVGDDFVGGYISRYESDALHGLHIGIQYLEQDMVKPMLALIREEGINEGTADALTEKADSIANDHRNKHGFELPGGFKIAQEGAHFSITLGDAGVKMIEEYVYEIDPPNTLVKQAKDIVAFVKQLGEDDALERLKRIKGQVLKELKAARSKEGFDEESFQKVQAVFVERVLQPFSVEAYFRIMRQLARCAAVKLTLYSKIYQAYQPAKGNADEA